MPEKKTNKFEYANIRVGCIAIPFLATYILIMVYFGIEQFYFKLSLPIGLIIGLQITTYYYYTKRFKKGLWPSIIGLIITLVIFGIVYRDYNVDLLKEVSLLKLNFDCVVASVLSLLLIDKVLDDIFDRNTSAKTDVNNRTKKNIKKRKNKYVKRKRLPIKKKKRQSPQKETK